MRSSDARINGRRVEDVSRRIKAQLLELARDINLFVEGIVKEKHDLLAQRRDDLIGYRQMVDDISGDHADDPDRFDAVVPAWITLLTQITADIHTPDDAAHIQALATRALAEFGHFEALAQRTSALWNELDDKAKHEMKVWGYVADAVEIVKDVSFVSAAMVATIYSGGLASGAWGSVGLGALGGATTLGGLRAADLTDPRPLADRTVAGTTEGALMGPTSEVGGAVEQSVRNGATRVLGESRAAEIATDAVAGSANMAAASGTYATAASLAHGDDIGAAVNAGVHAAAVGAPFGAGLGLVSGLIANAKNETTTGEQEPAESVKRPSGRVEAPRPGLYENLNVDHDPPGWVLNESNIKMEGTKRVIRTDVQGPNGKTGYCIRAYDPFTKKLEMREALLEDLPRWIDDGGVPLVEGKGTPTVAYLTMRQMKHLGVEYGELTTVKMSSIQNIRAIIELHLARAQGIDPNVAVLDTHSVKYADTSIVQSGHRVVGAKVGGNVWEKPLDALLEWRETRGTYGVRDPAIAAEHDKMIAEYGKGLVTRDTVVWMNYDIELQLSAFAGGP
ncbi:MAG TPA: hypothetical protein VL856_02725 [Acidimicrobiia bacterium]|jgi:hypothetical protein|nr:hypothetical protein [Acidimicrobiia bacterium]